MHKVSLFIIIGLPCIFYTNKIKTSKSLGTYRELKSKKESCQLSTSHRIYLQMECQYLTATNTLMARDSLDAPTRGVLNYG